MFDEFFKRVPVILSHLAKESKVVGTGPEMDPPPNMISASGTVSILVVFDEIADKSNFIFAVLSLICSINKLSVNTTLSVLSNNCSNLLNFKHSIVTQFMPASANNTLFPAGVLIVSPPCNGPLISTPANLCVIKGILYILYV